MPIFFYKKVKGCKPYPKVKFTTVIFCYIGKFSELPYITKNAPQGCAPRGDEVNCFAIPLGRGEFAWQTLFCNKLLTLRNKSYIIDLCNA